MQILSSITQRAMKLDGLKFKDLFVWLSQSQKRVSGSKPGETDSASTDRLWCPGLSPYGQA